MREWHVMTRGWKIFFVLTVVTVACGLWYHVSVGRLRSLGAVVTAPPTGWQEIETGTFSLYIPPGWRFRKLQGFDSHVGEFFGDGVVLNFDFGQYSDPLSEDDEPSYVVSHLVIDGMAAKTVSSRNPGHGITGVYFPSVSPPDSLSRDSLSIVSQDLTAAEQEVVLGIFRTIHFKGVDPSHM
jgi:hypothetical protein